MDKAEEAGFLLSQLSNHSDSMFRSFLSLYYPTLLKILLSKELQSGCCLHPNDTMFGITEGIISPINHLIDMVIARVVGRAIRAYMFLAGLNRSLDEAGSMAYS
ncbi:hypothetical protein NC651_017121 [Populus alba x Populus x berolinensis]|nr:hypothetical protein NC651_017121 [Populus alba x Populus x berolinensis]